MSSIPKIIHYCWFGGKPLPPLAIKCIESWKKYFPDYEIKEWNESNYDFRKIQYTSEAYDSKKYAFVSDYARFDILYQYGGLYFDVDVEVVKDMTDIIKSGAFAGLENPGNVNAGLGLGCPSGLPIYKEMLDYYKSEHFLNTDNSLNLETVVIKFSRILEKYGFTTEDEIQKVANIVIYPTDYFCPISTKDGILRKTDNTCTIHHFAQSWQPKWQIIARKIILAFGGIKLKNFIKKIFRMK